MKKPRSSGILLHISSLPGKFGIGDLGEPAYHCVDFMADSGTQYWQILPLNPTGFGNSPYQGLSAFAGNPLFIDPEGLVKLDLLSEDDLQDIPRFSQRKVNYAKIAKWKTNIYRLAFDAFLRDSSHSLVSEYKSFCSISAGWLEDFALFMTIREESGFASWDQWPNPLRMRDKAALRAYETTNHQCIEFHKFLQFIFFRQWSQLKEYANSKSVKFIGDIPIYVGFNCADVWANPQLFQLDENRQPLAVAGVPPDFFSENGQLWGNPLFDWDVHKKEKYSWWISRVAASLKTVDMVRLDHFRGFAGYYRIPAADITALNGEWIPGPGRHFFTALNNAFGGLPFIAEDLGVITPDVEALRDHYGLPGMRILQFAFGSDARHAFLPHNYPRNCVAYSGTHDNNTSLGWFKTASKKEREFCASYLGFHTRNIAHEMIRAVWQSPAATAIAPMQDFLRLGSWARMNTPSTIGGNWEWRMAPGSLSNKISHWLTEINKVYDRANKDR